VYGRVPLNRFVLGLTRNDVKLVAKVHGIHIPSRARKGGYDSLFQNHSCPICETYLSVFVLHSTKSQTDKNKSHYNKLDAKGKESTDLQVSLQRKLNRRRSRNKEKSA
jgi:hypothetical protein